MGVISGIVVYILLWWLILFMVLPFGAKAIEAPERGHATSAPQRPHLWRKVGVTSFLALILWFVAFAILRTNIFS